MATTSSFVTSVCSARCFLLPRLHATQLLNTRNFPSPVKVNFPLVHPVGAKIRTWNFRSISAAVGSESSEPIAVPRSVPVRVAYELLQAGHRYLDVRTPEEFGGGHASAAINIPYMFRAGAGMTKNPNFLKEVSSHFGKDTEIIVGCQSGKRSLMAATELLSDFFEGNLQLWPISHLLRKLAVE
ncbi:PREDICTED: thiosulfate sulfurtransferase 16, chloroplastic isoform X2 [Nelumbo nucifera]|uniref:Thiosulfate sulfurtransferase 16, chloroplastic isoform X2 n=1 Tax=Nelumbo nucifera TaxID=4432 RepID=A0A1U8AT88_NELNU|nr:PREDICTED: thiosulfate sulfurtransferase 16, chloroplastic isoform X2 [Nelumbo nucifera]